MEDNAIQKEAGKKCSFLTKRTVTSSGTCTFLKSCRVKNIHYFGNNCLNQVSLSDLGPQVRSQSSGGWCGVLRQGGSLRERDRLLY